VRFISTMSIHANLSPEAQERLNAQQRNSTISSAIIAILSIVVIAMVLSIFLLPPIFQQSPTVKVIHDPGITDDPPIKPSPVANPLKRKPTPPAASAAQTRVIEAHTVSTVSIPVPDVAVMAPSADYGDGDDFGLGGSGDTFGGGPGFQGIPRDFSKRCSAADRMARLLSEGGTPECEDAVVKALDWLQATQKPDGSWTNDHPVAMTGLALLAYLGHCETPQSPKYGETVLRGVTYLIDVGMKNNGRLSNKDATNIQWVYDHGIAAYALAEAYTFCNQLTIPIPHLDKVTKDSIDMIMQGQNDVGGWVYKFASANEGDNSVGFWQIQAMKAGKHTGLWPDSKFTRPSREALEWLEKAQGKNGAIGYRGDANRSPGLTGGGVLCFQLWDKGSSRAARKGIDYVAENSEFEWGKESSNLYYHYYHAQAMINHGGKEWQDYNLRFRDSLLKAQNPDGSWTQGGIKHGPISVHMATCQAALMLEGYYRFLPGTGGK
jgi:hypothetical protein